MADSDRPETALGRWSRLKRSRGEEDRAGPSDRADAPGGDPRQQPPTGGARPESSGTAVGDDAAVSTGLGEPGDGGGGEPAALALPEIASLTKDSDFTAFLREGVPQEIRRQALRALWRSDPVLACLDGLNDYDDDYSHTRTVSEAVRTAYRVGKGYLQDPPEAAEEAAEAEATSEPAAGADEAGGPGGEHVEVATAQDGVPMDAPEATAAGDAGGDGERRAATGRPAADADDDAEV